MAGATAAATCTTCCAAARARDVEVYAEQRAFAGALLRRRDPVFAELFAALFRDPVRRPWRRQHATDLCVLDAVFAQRLEHAVLDHLGCGASGIGRRQRNGDGFTDLHVPDDAEIDGVYLMPINNRTGRTLAPEQLREFIDAALDRWPAATVILEHVGTAVAATWGAPRGAPRALSAPARARRAVYASASRAPRKAGRKTSRG